MTSFVAIYKLVLRRLFNAGRAAAFAGLLALLLLIGFTIHRNDFAPAAQTVRVVATLGLLLIVPLVCLVIATPAIGEWVEDETLVYVWLRPVSRATLAGAPWLAAVTVALPANVVSMGLLAAVGSGGDTTVIWGAVASCMVATLAYSALFVLFGAWSKRALATGFVFVFIWEGLLTQYGPGFAQLSNRSYAVSILSNVTGVRLGLAGRATTSTVIMLIIVVGGGLALTTAVLRRKDVP